MRRKAAPPSSQPSTSPPMRSWHAHRGRPGAALPWRPEGPLPERVEPEPPVSTATWCMPQVSPSPELDTAAGGHSESSSGAGATCSRPRWRNVRKPRAGGEPDPTDGARKSWTSNFAGLMPPTAMHALPAQEVTELRKEHSMPGCTSGKAHWSAGAQTGTSRPAAALLSRRVMMHALPTKVATEPAQVVTELPLEHSMPGCTCGAAHWSTGLQTGTSRPGAVLLSCQDVMRALPAQLDTELLLGHPMLGCTSGAGCWSREVQTGTSRPAEALLSRRDPRSACADTAAFLRLTPGAGALAGGMVASGSSTGTLAWGSCTGGAARGGSRTCTFWLDMDGNCGACGRCCSLLVSGVAHSWSRPSPGRIA
mmetsp:Transcript_69665/g.192644  ORF Transcript_69665/g.192644 Transcript_69665/m.192644 type:complete len:366 (-) Transcript_69665:1037-2134(-)